MKKFFFLIVVFTIAANSIFGQTKTVKELKVEALKKLYFTTNALNEVFKITNNQDSRLAMLTDAEKFYKEFEIAYKNLKTNLPKELIEQFDLIIKVYSQIAKTENLEIFSDPSTLSGAYTAVSIGELKIDKIAELLLK